MLSFCLVALLFGPARFPAIDPGEVPKDEDIENGPRSPAERKSVFLELVKWVSRDVEAAESLRAEKDTLPLCLAFLGTCLVFFGDFVFLIVGGDGHLKKVSAILRTSFKVSW